MDRVPGVTLNELTYRRPEVLDENMIGIAYQLGIHSAFAYIFGVKDGYQTNYIFNPVNKLLTRIDKDTFLNVPDDPGSTFSDNDAYTQEIAACELNNLKYIPSFRSGDDREEILRAFKVGFMEKYGDVKAKRERLLELVRKTREKWMEVRPPLKKVDYVRETEGIVAVVDALIGQDPEAVIGRLFRAKAEFDRSVHQK
jgi:hypothetical protein